MRFEFELRIRRFVHGLHEIHHRSYLGRRWIADDPYASDERAHERGASWTCSDVSRKREERERRERERGDEESEEWKRRRGKRERRRRRERGLEEEKERPSAGEMARRLVDAGSEG
jgi:hypothetical protein